MLHPPLYMERDITARHTGMHPIVSANPALNLEPEPGVEPRSNAYKAIVIAIILFRHGTPGRIRTHI
jgi:hypothetical protein